MPTHILYGVVLIAAGIGGLWYDGRLRKRGKHIRGSAVIPYIGGLALGVGTYQIVTYFVHVR